MVVRRRGSGIYVSPRLYQNNIGLVFGRHAFQPGTSPFCAMLVECCRRRAESHSESFSFFLDVSCPEEERDGPGPADLIDALSKGRINGILLVARHSERQEAWLREQGVPVVSFTGGAAAPFQPATVGFDLQELALQGARELAARGCRQIAMISPSSKGAGALQAALESLSLPFRQEFFVKPIGVDGESRMQLGGNAMRRLIAAGGKAPPDGVIITDDMLTEGALTAARSGGLPIGRGLLFASHANKGSSTLDSCKNQLILLEVNPEEMVEAMFIMLEGMMNGSAKAPAARLVSCRVYAGQPVGLSDM